MNKKTLITAVFAVLLSGLCVLASPVKISVDGTATVAPGDDAYITVTAEIEAGTQLQGVQADFEFSENFPSLDGAEFEITENTTGWETAGISKFNMLAIGAVNENSSVLTGRISFKIPSDADGEYTFTIPYAAGASAAEEIEADVNTSEFVITVSGRGNTGNAGNTGNTGSASGGDPKEEKEPENDVKTPAKWENPFTDVKETDWFYESVKFSAENSLFGGTAKDMFSPNDNLTRAMLVTVLYRNEKEPAVSGTAFSDVEKGSYYENAVIWAKENGIVNGVSETEFAPDSLILREQIAAIMYRYASYKGKDLSVGENTNILSYDDFADISEYAIPAMQYMAGSGLMKGKTESTLNPQDNATRAEAATILMRFLK